MVNAWVFPGQGSQKLGMADDLVKHPLGRERFALASEKLGRDLAAICAGTAEGVNNQFAVTEQFGMQVGNGGVD